MRHLVLKLITAAALLGLSALCASANSVSLTLNGSGSIAVSSSGSGNLTLCLGGGSTCANSVSATGVGTGDLAGNLSLTISATAPISLAQVGSTCVFSNASLTGVTFVAGDISGTFTSLTVSQSAAQVTSGLASISGTGVITSEAGLTVNVPFNFTGTLNVGAGVDICAIPLTGITGSIAPTPEPATLALAGLGLLALGGAVRRRLSL